MAKLSDKCLQNIAAMADNDPRLSMIEHLCSKQETPSVGIIHDLGNLVQRIVIEAEGKRCT